MSDDRPSPRPRRSTQESPLVWGLLVAIMLITFVTSLVTAVAEPTTYRTLLAFAAGAFLAVSVVQLVRSSRERRRLSQDASNGAAGNGAAGNGAAVESSPGTGRDGHGGEPGTTPRDDTSAG